jgi:hypothetical protein
VGDDGGVVGVALVGQQVDPVQPQAGAAAGMHDPCLQPLAARPRGHQRLAEIRAGREAHLRLAHRDGVLVVLRQHDALHGRALGQGDGQLGLRYRTAVALVAFQQPQPGAGRQGDSHTVGMRAPAARHQPQRRQGLLPGRHLDPRVAAVDQHVVVVGQAVERSVSDLAGKPLGGLRQHPDQAAQVGPAPVLVPLAREFGDVARPYGGGDAHAALAYLS